jgi:threonine dehydratase
MVWDILEDHVADIMVVDDEQATLALVLVLERSKLLVEPAGAVGVAALLEDFIPEDANDPICIVLSGGNIDLLFLDRAVRNGLEIAARFAKFDVIVSESPGSLAMETKDAAHTNTLLETLTAYLL